MTRFRPTVDSFRPGTLSLPGEAYCSAETFAKETDRVFAREWVCAGLESEVAQVGDVVPVTVAGESLILVRDKTGALGAFYNVCRHRGTRLCQEPASQARSIRCPYHGWTYGLSGDLQLAPHMDEVAGFEIARHGLHRVALETCEGFVFVCLDPAPEPFSRTAALLERLSPWSLASLRSRHRIDYEVAANWKLIVENYSECYHCPLVHPAFSRLINYRSGCNDLDEGAMLGGYMDLADPAESLTTTGQRCGPVIDGLPAADRGRVYFYALFPNLTISLHPDYVMTFLIEPKAPDRTLVRCQWLFPDDTGSREPVRTEQAVDFWDRTNREDWQVCALVQQGVASRAYRPSPMSNTESLPAALHSYLAKILDR